MRVHTVPGVRFVHGTGVDDLEAFLAAMREESEAITARQCAGCEELIADDEFDGHAQDCIPEVTGYECQGCNTLHEHVDEAKGCCSQ